MDPACIQLAVTCDVAADCVYAALRLQAAIGYVSTKMGLVFGTKSEYPMCAMQKALKERREEEKREEEETRGTCEGSCRTESVGSAVQLAPSAIGVVHWSSALHMFCQATSARM
jgi:hypothetical protein